MVLEGIELGCHREKEGFEVADRGIACTTDVSAGKQAEDIFCRLRKFPELWPGQQISKFGPRTMTYSGPVGVIGRNVLLLREPEDALLEDKLGLGGSHGYPGEAERHFQDRKQVDVEKSWSLLFIAAGVQRWIHNCGAGAGCLRQGSTNSATNDNGSVG